MADTKTNPTPLDPSPKRVEGEVIGVVNTTVNGEVYGTLHKPPLVINKEDKGQETPVIVNEPPHTKDVKKIKKLVVDELTVKGKANIPDIITEEALPEKIEQGIENSLLNGSLKTVLQNKTFGVSDFPLTSDIDNQHSTVNEGLLPNGDMEELTETQINKIANTLKRIINKGWLRVSTLRALKLTSVMYDETVISITASSVVFSAEGVLSGISRLIMLDIANASYSYAVGSYTVG